MSYSIAKPPKQDKRLTRLEAHCETRADKVKPPKDRYAEDIRNSTKDLKRQKMLRTPRRG